jgi:tRNA-uridine 2-sulfurtransferase
MSTKIKALTLLSGGLDSAVATKLVMDQGIECIAINFSSPFCTCNQGGKCHSKQIADDLKIEYHTIAKGIEFIDIIKDPDHGYGKGLNPCVDCKIYILKKSRALMSEFGASFVITGEVLGQRPMSQHRLALNIIEKESGLEGLILRPLSASLLEETIPEKKGWIDRSRMLSINGRGRHTQLEFARNFNIESYACAGGGCLLTDKQFAVKLKDLFDSKKDVTFKDINMLKIGRHFKYGADKIIVGRNANENNMLKMMRTDDELVFEVPVIGSPITLLQGGNSCDSIKFAAQMTLLYSDNKDDMAIVKYGTTGFDNEIEAVKITHEDVIPYNLVFKKLGNKKSVVDIIKVDN